MKKRGSLYRGVPNASPEIGSLQKHTEPMGPGLTEGESHFELRQQGGEDVGHQMVQDYSPLTRERPRELGREPWECVPLKSPCCVSFRVSSQATLDFPFGDNTEKEVIEERRGEGRKRGRERLTDRGGERGNGGKE